MLHYCRIFAARDKEVVISPTTRVLLTREEDALSHKGGGGRKLNEIEKEKRRIFRAHNAATKNVPLTRALGPLISPYYCERSGAARWRVRGKISTLLCAPSFAIRMPLEDLQRRRCIRSLPPFSVRRNIRA